MRSDEITLEQVRIVAERLRDEGKPISVSAIRDILRRGSAGTIGAFLKSVRFEWEDAKSFDLLNISDHLKSAYIQEIERHIRTRVDIETQKRLIVENQFNEMCVAKEEADKKITILQNNLKIQKSKGDQTIRSLDLELARTKERLNSIDIINKEFRLNLKRTKENLDVAQQEITALKARRETDNEKINKYEEENRLLRKDLSNMKKERDVAQKCFALAEQKIDHSKSIATEQKNRSEKLQLELEKSKQRNIEITERLHLAETRAAVAESQLKDQNLAAPQRCTAATT